MTREFWNAKVIHYEFQSDCDPDVIEISGQHAYEHWLHTYKRHNCGRGEEDHKLTRQQLSHSKSLFCIAGTVFLISIVILQTHLNKLSIFYYLLTRLNIATNTVRLPFIKTQATTRDNPEEQRRLQP